MFTYVGNFLPSALRAEIGDHSLELFNLVLDVGVVLVRRRKSVSVAFGAQKVLSRGVVKSVVRHIFRLSSRV